MERDLNSQKNITYFLGAGASYHTCPIWHEQAEKMCQMGNKYVSKKYPCERLDELNKVEPEDKFFWYLTYFGKQGKKFITIDNYAKILFVQKNSEFGILKAVISLFFTIWENINDDIKYRDINDKKVFYKESDSRYVSLLTHLTEFENRLIRLKNNVKFVSWNYDLQLEKTLLQYAQHEKELVDLDRLNRFNPGIQTSPLAICHLNGYHGFMENNEDGFLHLIKPTTISDNFEAINYLFTSRMSRTDFMNFINFAWEDKPRAKFAREQAKEIFTNTDLLIIIGYSFPEFNKVIDKELFSRLKPGTRIIYQDPNASKKIIEFLTKGKKVDIELITDTQLMNYFHLPYDWQ